MKTIRDYYQSPAIAMKATVLQITPSDTGGTVILDHTLFCVQGGGQPADHGTIAGIPVTHVEAAKDSDIVFHSVSSLEGLKEGSEVELRIDVPRRVLNSKLHTGGHLLAALVEEILPGSKACGGHHWPGEARVEFIYDGQLPSDFEQALCTMIDNAVANDLTVKRSLTNEGDRFVQIGEYPALRCGGTHCWSLKQLGRLIVRGIKQKKDRLRIGYDVSVDLSSQRYA
ncbi:MAG: hypothetical protein JNM99_10650 [Verrucomicrobiaceae bacterium]|nr:hypothetical protein [Verrucomicrobiaceae bacterium]